MCAEVYVVKDLTAGGKTYKQHICTLKFELLYEIKLRVDDLWTSW